MTELAGDAVATEPDGTVKIAIKDLKKSYGDLVVLNGITTDIAHGEVVCVIGPSGSGKSTFLRCLNKLEDISGGQVVVDGFDLTDPKVDLDRVRQHIGMVFQHFNLFPHMTVLDNVTLAPLLTKKMDRATAEKRALELLGQVGLAEKAGVKPSTLSGGQKQRVAIARALLLNPRLLILDDSTSSVDLQTEYKIQKALDNLMKGRTSFVIAQRISTVLNADQILVLDKGKVVARGTHEDLMENSPIYAEIYNSQLVGDAEGAPAESATETQEA